MRNIENCAKRNVTSPTVVLIAANIIAVGIYLIAASFGWVERAAADIPGAAGGGAVVWFVFAVPVFLLSFVGNIGGGVLTLIHRYRTGHWHFFWWAWVAVLGLWTLAVAYDFSRHGS